MDSYVRLLRKTTADKLWLIIDTQCRKFIDDYSP